MCQAHPVAPCAHYLYPQQTIDPETRAARAAPVSQRCIRKRCDSRTMRVVGTASAKLRQ